MSKETWIVTDYEETVVYVGDYEGAKKAYAKELENAERDLADECFSESEMGLKVILARVDRALNMYLTEDEENNKIWEMEKLDFSPIADNLKKYYVAKDEKGCYWRNNNGSHVLENKYLFAYSKAAHEYADKKGLTVAEVVLKETSNLVDVSTLLGKAEVFGVEE